MQSPERTQPSAQCRAAVVAFTPAQNGEHAVDDAGRILPRLGLQPGGAGDGTGFDALAAARASIVMASARACRADSKVAGLASFMAPGA